VTNITRKKTIHLVWFYNWALRSMQRAYFATYMRNAEYQHNVATSGFMLHVDRYTNQIRPHRSHRLTHHDRIRIYLLSSSRAYASTSYKYQLEHEHECQSHRAVSFPVLVRIVSKTKHLARYLDVRSNERPGDESNASIHVSCWRRQSKSWLSQWCVCMSTVL